MKRRLVVVLAALVGLPLLVFVLVVAVSSTSWGEDQFRAFVASAVSEAIPGTVTVETLAHISLLSPPGRVSADVWNVEFTTENRPVIQIEHARIDYSWLDLLGGKVLIEGASVHEGTVTVEVTDDGGLYLVQAFDGPSSAAPGNASSAPIDITLRNLQVHDLSVLVRLPDRLIQIEQVSGRVDIAREEGGKAIVVTLGDISGVVAKPNILGSKLSLDRTRGTLGGSKAARVDLDIDGEFMSSPVGGSVRYLPEQEPSVEIVIEPEGAAAELLANVADLNSVFGDKVSIEVR